MLFVLSNIFQKKMIKIRGDLNNCVKKAAKIALAAMFFSIYPIYFNKQNKIGVKKDLYSE